MKKSRIVAWSIWMIASVFYAYQYILRVLPNIMLDDITNQFHIGAATFGQFSGLYYLGYSAMHLPIGILLDRYGPKRVLPICILLTVVGLSPLLFSTFWVYPIVGRIMIGIGSSAAILGVFKVIRMIFQEKQFTKMLSFSVTIGLIGAIWGGGPVEYLKTVMGYHAVIWMFSIMGAALAAATYWVIPNIKRKQKETTLSGIKHVLTNKKVIFSCIFAGLMVGPLEGFADVWASSYLRLNYHFDAAMAASIPSLIFIGMCFGAPVLSWFSSKLKSHFITIIGTAIFMGLSFFALLMFHVPAAILSIGFILVGVCCAYQIIAIYKASTFVSEDHVGLTTAVANMIIMAFGYAFHTIMGAVVEYSGGVNSPAALSSGIWIIPAALAIAAVGYSALYVTEKKKVPVIQE